MTRHLSLVRGAKRSPQKTPATTLQKKHGPFHFGNFTGAFADGMILFPLIALLAQKPDFSSTRMLVTAAIASLVAAYLFRVPMAIQPLKAVVLAAVASGASAAEVRWSGALLGVACLAVSYYDADRLARQVPRALVHGLQLGLGVILVQQAVKALGVAPFSELPLGAPAWAPLLLLLIAVVSVVKLAGRTTFPLFGFLATGGLLWAVFHATPTLGAPSTTSTPALLRWNVIGLLVLPQVALTLANSVVATADVAHRYFGSRASRVTPRRLLHSIGFGNLLAALGAGLPFCHGSGGLTAQVRGGASHWSANVIFSVSLFALVLWQTLGNSFATLQYPRFLLALLLAATGVFHLFLAKATWQDEEERARLLLMGCAAAATQNLLVVLIVGVLPDATRWAVDRISLLLRSAR